jgi:hypothetical protein
MALFSILAPSMRIVPFTKPTTSLPSSKESTALSVAGRLPRTTAPCRSTTTPPSDVKTPKPVLPSMTALSAWIAPPRVAKIPPLWAGGPPSPLPEIVFREWQPEGRFADAPARGSAP